MHGTISRKNRSIRAPGPANILYVPQHEAERGDGLQAPAGHDRGCSHLERRRFASHACPASLVHTRPPSAGPESAFRVPRPENRTPPAAHAVLTRSGVETGHGSKRNLHERSLWTGRLGCTGSSRSGMASSSWFGSPGRSSWLATHCGGLLVTLLAARFIPWICRARALGPCEPPPPRMPHYGGGSRATSRLAVARLIEVDAR